jgi:predicted DsbA family dithiol-disulfide isomerase
MKTRSKLIAVRVYQDVLCPWSYLAERRMEPLRREFAETLQWTFRPYPLRIPEVLPTPEEVTEHVEELRRARREKDGHALTPELWLSGDPPRSSVPALAALEAARLQGSAARAALADMMRVAALEQGVNVTRRDTVFELADRVGLQMNRFTAAFAAPETSRLIREEHRLACARGVTGVPTLVIGGRWMLTGLRETSEYRDHILGCLEKLEERTAEERMRQLH